MDNELRMQKSLAQIEQHLDEIAYSMKELAKRLKNTEHCFVICSNEEFGATLNFTKEEQENEGRN